MTSTKKLLIATRPFTSEVRWHSWWHLWTTIALLAMAMAAACSELPWPIRLPSSLIAGLTLVRFFIIYHDHQHRAILRGSRLASLIMTIFGLVTLNPPSVWKRSHDHHHLNNSKTFGINVGSFPLMTVEGYSHASLSQRIWYASSRHPLTMAAGYVTVFLVGMCVRPLLANPRRHFDAGAAIVCHAGLMCWLGSRGIDDLFLAGLVPFAISNALGAYLFFAQHNFPDVRLSTGREWDYTFAALHSSSYIRMGRLMQWFTGNIGFHHVHHLNSKIPFYRLPDAMAAIDELQSPGTTSLHPRDIAACLRLKLWDSDSGRLVPWNGRGEATRNIARKAA